MKVPGKPRRIEIDFVRGCAILMVMLLHFKAPHTGIWVCDAFKDFFGHVGGHGVPLFFVLSGFLVGGLLLKEYKDTDEVKSGRFLLRRMFKIWPPFYFLLLVHTIVRRHPLNTFLWQNMFHLQNYFGTSIAQTWSLAVEEHFYLALALLMGWMARRHWSPRQMLTMFVSISAIAIVWRCAAIWHNSTQYLYDRTWTQYFVDSLLFGVMISLLYHFKPSVYRRLTKRWWPLALIVVIGVLSVWTPRNAWTEPFDNPLSYVSCGAFLTLVMEHSGALVKSRLYRAIATIGVYSYAMYLWHSAMLSSGEYIVAHFEPKLAWFLALGVQIAGTLVIAYVATRIIEWPFLFWRERIPSLRDNRPLIHGANEGPIHDELVSATVE